MVGGLRQASNFLNQLFAFQLPRCVQIFAFDQLRNRRPASYSRNAAFGAKANVGDALYFQLRLFQSLVFQSDAEFQDISARWVFQLRAGVGSFNFTRVARVLEMVEEFGGIHRSIVMLQSPGRGKAPSPHGLRARSSLPGNTRFAAISTIRTCSTHTIHDGLPAYNRARR